MALLVVAAIGRLVYFFIVNGYLPLPFFHDVDDTFMDWYNTAIWAYRAGTYDLWKAVYPPLSFVFLSLFSIKSCYEDTGRYARSCDPIGIYFLAACVVTNFILAYFIYKKVDSKTALYRSLALGFGTPMLFAWERGNLVLPCFTFFMLGHGRLLKSAWARWLCVGMSINFKPYLVLSMAGRVLRRQWRGAEGCAVAIMLVYAVCLTWFGHGDPMEVYANINAFVEKGSAPPPVDSLGYSSTFQVLLALLQSPIPVMNYLGSWTLETMERLIPLATRLGQLGVLGCLAGAIFRPTAVPVHRLAALSLVFLMTGTELGMYSQGFLFFFVFMDRWNTPGQVVSLMAAYLLCIPFDYQFMGVAHLLKDDYLSNKTVGYNLGLTVGMFARPALMLILEYALVAAAISDLLRGSPVTATTPARLPTVGV